MRLTKLRRQAQAPAANEANSKGKSHEGSGRQGRHRHRRRHPDRRGRGARARRGVRVAVLDVDGAGGEKVAAADPQGCRAWQVDITDDARLEQCGRGRQALRPAGLPGQPGRHLPGRRRGIGPRGLAARAGHQPGQRGHGARARAPTWWRPAAAPSSTSPASRPRPRRRAAGSIRCPRPRWCSSHATWRWTLAGDRIRVNSVSPGWTWSRVMDEITGGDRAKTDRVAADYHLLGRVGDPREVADVVAFPAVGTRVLRHRRRLRGRRRLFGHGSRAGQARHSAPG